MPELPKRAGGVNNPQVCLFSRTPHVYRSLTRRRLDQPRMGYGGQAARGCVCGSIASFELALELEFIGICRRPAKARARCIQAAAGRLGFGIFPRCTHIGSRTERHSRWVHIATLTTVFGTPGAARTKKTLLSRRIGPEASFNE